MFKNFSIKTKKLLIFSFLIISFFAFIFFGFSKTYSPAYAIDPDIPGGNTGSSHGLFKIHDDFQMTVSTDYPDRCRIHYSFEITSEQYNSIFIEEAGIFDLRVKKFSSISRLLEFSSDSSIPFDSSEHIDTIPLNNLKDYFHLNSSGGYSCTSEVFYIFSHSTADYYLLLEFGEMVSSPFSQGSISDRVFSRISISSNYVLFNESDIALSTLNNNYSSLSSAEISLFQKFAGFELLEEDSFSLTLNYKKCYGFNDIRDESSIFSVPFAYVHSSSLVFNYIKNLLGFTNISYFNCIYANVYFLSNDISQVLDDRIVLQAKEYSFTYDNYHHKGSLDIIYYEFQYSNFCIKIQDNDLIDGVRLALYVYPTFISDYSSTQYSLTFSYALISERCLNNIDWYLTDLNSDNFSITGSTSSTYAVVGSDSLVVIFPKNNQDSLKNLSILCTADIIEDYECEVNINYTNLIFEDGNILEEEKTLSVDDIMYSELVKYNGASYFLSQYGSIINSAINPSFLNGINYFTFSNVSIVSSGEDLFDVNVNYTYHTILEIKNTLNNDVVFNGLTKNSLMYKFSEFNYSAPVGFRVSSLTCNNDLGISFDNFYPSNSDISINTNLGQKKIIVLTANLSDKWPVKINYLSRYKNSPFAELKTFESEINVSDYGNLEELTGDDIENIIGESNISYLQFNEIPIRIDDDSITVSKSGDLFEFDFGYTKAFIKGKNSDGSSDFYEIALTPFSIWSSSFGSDWSIQSLNTKDFKFTYSNEVAKDKLYGFFTVMTFKSQVSDFDSWFTEYTSSGCCSFFNSKEVRGNGLYRFLANNESLLTIAGGTVGFLFGHPIAGAVAGAALQFGVMSASEFLNDENGIYYSYFLYLDGTTDMPYASNFGADDYYDTDSGFKNFVQDVKDDVLDFLDDSGISKVFKILLGIIIALIILWGIFELISLIVKFIRKIKPSDDGKKNKKGG